jgi:hypothetical protein
MYKIVIKTKRRVERFRKKTYNCIIKRYGFNEKNVHLFVSDDRDYADYSKAYPGCKVIKGPPGIARIDNFIVNYFDEGEIYIYMNDDVSGIYQATSKKDLVEVEDLKGLLNKLVKECQKKGYTYGGFGPVLNPYFMYSKNSINYHLSLVMDPVSICINNKDIQLTEIPVPMPDGTIFKGESSDAEKCIQHYMSKGGIIRFNHYAPKVEYYGKVGGYQGRNAYTEKYTAEYMLEKYPEYISGINFKKNGTTSLRLKKNPIIKKKLTIFLLSLDNKKGKERRNLLNYKYKWIKGIYGKDCDEYIKKKMKSRYNISEKTLNGKLGCFASYIYMFKKIIKEKINNVIILEDDCFKVEDFNIEDLGDKPIYLNGVFHHPKNYNKSTTKWRSELKGIKQGINKLEYNNLRITGTLGIYLPKYEQVKNILDKILKSKRFTSIDSHLSNLKIIDRFYYPSLYKHDDNYYSNISNKGLGLVQNYKFIRKNPHKKNANNHDNLNT